MPPTRSRAGRSRPCARPCNLRQTPTRPGSSPDPVLGQAAPASAIGSPRRSRAPIPPSGAPLPLTEPSRPPESSPHELADVVAPAPIEPAARTRQATATIVRRPSPSRHARTTITTARLPGAPSPHDIESSPHTVTDEETSPCGGAAQEVARRARSRGRWRCREGTACFPSTPRADSATQRAQRCPLYPSSSLILALLASWRFSLLSSCPRSRCAHCPTRPRSTPTPRPR